MEKKFESDQHQFLTRPEAAAYLHVKPQTLSSWAVKGTGPAVCKIGKKRVVYRLIDLQAFVESGLTPRG
ncbi:MAG: helix-turn-helix domain-containing protein [Proteobacteria bacterium]|nr:helix-turn-helix domain-containing protein [Pseudomonadota bacterium]MBU0966924.1 helix-turn-helix domain-containing protein [Pseudomonadota bacterium]